MPLLLAAATILQAHTTGASKGRHRCYHRPSPELQRGAAYAVGVHRRNCKGARCPPPELQRRPPPELQRAKSDADGVYRRSCKGPRRMLPASRPMPIHHHALVIDATRAPPPPTALLHSAGHHSCNRQQPLLQAPVTGAARFRRRRPLCCKRRPPPLRASAAAAMTAGRRCYKRWMSECRCCNGGSDGHGTMAEATGDDGGAPTRGQRATNTGNGAAVRNGTGAVTRACSVHRGGCELRRERGQEEEPWRSFRLVETIGTVQYRSTRIVDVHRP
jgi:hypothetical protein